MSGLALKIAGSGLTFLAGVAVARAVGPQQFGLYSVAFAMSTLAATVAGGGLPLLVTKEIAARASLQDWTQLHDVTRLAMRRTLQFAACAAALAALALLAPWQRAQFNVVVAAGCAGLVAALALNALRAAVLRGLGHPLLGDAPDLLMQPTIVFGLASITALAGWPAGAASALAWQLGAALATLATGLLLLRPRLARLPARPDPAAGAPPGDWTGGAAASLAMAAFAMLESQFGLYALQALRGGADVGQFQAARQIVSLVSIGLVGINLPLQSRLAAAWARGDRQESQRLVSATARLGFAVAAVATLLLIPFAGAFLRMFGTGFEAAADALRILAVAQLVNAAAGPCGVTLAMTGHVRRVPSAIIAAIVVNALLCVALVPRFGDAGAAVAACGSMVTWNVLLAARVRRLTGLATLALGGPAAPGAG